MNNSSSVEVSSESYETIFQRIIRDLQKELVVGALFEELPMSSKILTMLVEPDAGKATWVAATMVLTRLLVMKLKVLLKKSTSVLTNWLLSPSLLMKLKKMQSSPCPAAA